MCVFRFKMWWMTQRMGTCGQEVPIETQFLLIEAHNGSDIDGGLEDQAAATYAVLLPLLEGDFRAVLQGNDQNEIEICVESGMCYVLKLLFSGKSNHEFFLYIYMVIFAVLHGDEMCVWFIVGCPAVEEFDGTHLVFVGAGSDPYEVITNAVK